MRSGQRGSILGSIAGIAVCGGIGRVAAWALITAMGLGRTPGAVLAAGIGMVVALAAWAWGTSLLPALGWIR